MFFLFRALILLTIPLVLLAEGVSWNIGLKSNMGRGEQGGIDYNYLENFISGSIEVGHWYLDLSVESSQPPEYGFKYQGIDRFFLSYIGNARSLEIGDISAVFGRGLALNLDENQAIDFDNEIMGLRFSSVFLENHEIDLLAGFKNQYRFYSPSSDLREPDGEAAYELVGAEATMNSESGMWSLIPYLIASRMQSDFVWQELDADIGAIVTDTVTQKMNAIQAGWGQSIYGENWDLYLEYNKTWKAFDYPVASQSIQQLEHGQSLISTDLNYNQEGQAFNLQLNWFPEWFTTLFEYKRYLNGPETSSQKRNPMLLATKPLPWQMGPTGIREHDISLLGNVTHPVDYGDELGWNLELRKTLSDSWSMVINGAQTSQSSPDGDPGILPTQDFDRNPWQEYYAEFEYSGSSFYQRLLIAYTRSVLSGQSAAEIMEHYTFVPAYLSWHPNENLVLSTVVELQNTKVYGELYSGDVLEGHNFQSGHFIASADYEHNYSAAIIWDTSNDPGLLTNGAEIQHWVSGEVSVKPRDGMWLRASYGKEKGGVRCTGGVCRVLNPFEGFRFALEWRL
ncbi:MAG: hypothetical protein HON27_06990 [Candidatus Marinimicrobia bacterium]|nr:hypothetical protein [Candidatus Neomarinimicrobiota bacterium]MBT4945899.1 hypothetical protein [Candidatus Neomarinimicrobiota bacterium]MBT6010969.1 hypothetical protein [Candidatus Neomarinimicrobiota bacterium]